MRACVRLCRSVGRDMGAMLHESPVPWHTSPVGPCDVRAQVTVTWVWVWMWEQQIYIPFTATPGFKAGKLLIPPLNRHSVFVIRMTGERISRTSPPFGCPRWQRWRRWRWFPWRSPRKTTGWLGPDRDAGTIQTQLGRKSDGCMCYLIHTSFLTQLPLSPSCTAILL